MTDSGWVRVAAWGGIVSVVTSALGTFLVGQPPAADATISKIRMYYAGHHAALLWQMILLSLGAVALIAFASGLRSYLRGFEGGSGHLSATTFAGGITIALLVLLGLFLEVGLIYRAAPRVDDALLRVMFDALTTGAVFFAFPVALYVGAATVVIGRTAAMPRWIYALGVLTAVANVAAVSQLFVNSGPWTPGGSATFIPFLLLVIWEIAVAATMISRSRELATARTTK
jgi:hypothetical protein